MARMPRLAPGDPAPLFVLPGIDGREHALADYRGQPVALVFSSCSCPYVMAWEERIDELAREYEGRATVLAIVANDHVDDSFWAMQRRAAERYLAYPLLRDQSQDVARAYGATRTPEVFVLDPAHRVAYRGAPDSDHSDPNTAEPYMRRALEAVLAGRSPAFAETRAVGSTIKWRPLVRTS
jgi:peroxiredoxin